MNGYQYKYQVALWWSDRDEAFIAMVPEVPGCIIDGPTPEAALSNLNEVVEICLDYYREKKLPLPRPAGRLLSVQDEFDWKTLPDEEMETRAASPVSSSAQCSTKPKTSRRITSRSTHATT